MGPSVHTSLRKRRGHLQRTVASRIWSWNMPIMKRIRPEADTATRQLFELIQNGADALSGSAGGRIWLRLTPSHLYCADEGQPIDRDGVRALMFSHLSPKRGTSEIGRFGLGFKSVLGVTDRPEFFGRSGSFRFDRNRSSEIIGSVAPGLERYPVLRLPEILDPWAEADNDQILDEMMTWASNVVRLPLLTGANEIVEQQIKGFPCRVSTLRRTRPISSFCRPQNPKSPG